jgi:Tfp pilus assembly protein PilN
VEKRMRDYNFFEIFEKKRTGAIRKSPSLLIGIVLLLLIGGVSVGLVVRNMSLEKQISDYEDKIGAIKTSSEYIEANKLQDSIDALKQYDENAEIALNKFQASNLLGTEILTTLSSAIPSQASLKSLRMNNGFLDASVDVPDRKTASELILNFKESGLFQDVHLANLTLNQGGTTYTAVVQCFMKNEEISREGEAE